MSNTLNLEKPRAKHGSSIKKIDKVDSSRECSLTNEEQAMFLEIAEVMKRHSGKTRCFNLALDHQHFPIAEDEVLCEVNDPKNRVLKSVVVKADAGNRPRVKTNTSLKQPIRAVS